MKNKVIKKFLVVLLIVSALSLTACAASMSPVSGLLYTEVKAPLTSTNADISDLKKGTASANSILGLVATGDASIKAACENGNISKVVFVDYENKTILGIYSTFTTIVYGK